MDIRKIKQLIKLVNESKISELEISEGKEIIRINRSLPTITNPIMQVAYTLPIPPSNITAKKSTNNISNLKESSTIISKNHIIYSPMVGTFYRTPGGVDTKPFIEINQNVNIGDILCIIEAMKMMNQIKADKSGIIKSILVENGQPVEYNEPLIIIE